MQIWYIKDGKKVGPLEIYEIRALVREGKVRPDTRVWHEDAPGWLPAGEVDVLEGEFLLEGETGFGDNPPLLPEEDAALQEKKIIHPREPFTPWRRLAARWFDFNLYFLIFCLGAWASTGKLPGLDIPENPWYLVMQALPWLLIEGVLIHLKRTTPGKWLLGLEVEKLGGSNITLGASVMRSVRVWILGMGMGLGILTIIGHLAAYFIGRKKGAPLWDLASGFQVRTKKISRQKVVIFVILYLIVNSLLAWLLWPVLQELTAKAAK